MWLRGREFKWTPAQPLSRETQQQQQQQQQQRLLGGSVPRLLMWANYKIEAENIQRTLLSEMPAAGSGGGSGAGYRNLVE